MALVMLGAAIWDGAFRKVSWLPDWPRIRRLFSLGSHAALQIGFEAAVFVLVGALASRLDEVSLAAHGMAINVISVAFMVPLGISSAAAVRVGNAVGRL